MGQTIKIVSVRIDTVADAPGNSVYIDGKGRGGKDTSAEVYHSPGLYGLPVENDNGISEQIGENRIIVAINDYNFSINMNPGEVVIYSRASDGTLKAYTHYKNDGTIIIANDNGKHQIDPDGTHVFNDGTVSAVSFTKLKEGFDQLVTDFNSHVHTGNLGNPTSAPTASSTATVDDSEVVEIKFP